MMANPSTLLKIPPELREMIFRRCIKSVNNQTPPIIAALVGDLDLYKEALRLFWTENHFRLNRQNFVAMRSLTQTAAENIRKLKIDLTWDVGPVPHQLGARAFIPRPIIRFSRIECLSFSPGCLSPKITIYWIIFLLLQFPTIKQISLLSNAFTENPGLYQWRVRLLNHHLRVKGVLKTVNTGNGGEKWIWRAPQRQTLKFGMVPLISANSDP